MSDNDDPDREFLEESATDEAEDDDLAEVFTSHTAALDQALRTTPTLPRDLAAVHLARRYAAILDDAEQRLTDAAEEDEDASGTRFARVVTVITRVGPRYEAVLDRLGMSPGARPASRTGEPHGVDPTSAALDQLRSSADAADGFDPAAHLDPAVAEALADD